MPMIRKQDPHLAWSVVQKNRELVQYVGIAGVLADFHLELRRLFWMRQSWADEACTRLRPQVGNHHETFVWSGNGTGVVSVSCPCSTTPSSVMTGMARPPEYFVLSYTVALAGKSDGNGGGKKRENGETRGSEEIAAA
jgi:hypothetical protein